MSSVYAKTLNLQMITYIVIFSPWTYVLNALTSYTAEGLAALKYYLEYYPDENRPSNPTLLKLTKLVLNLSSFEFDGKYYIQKNGVAMGTKMGQVMYVCLLATLRRRCFSRTLVPKILC